MRRLFILIMATISMGIVNAQQVGPNVSWDNPTHDFGEIKEEGGKVTHNFSFTNTGNQPLVITNVRPSCGCTSSNYTREPVQPGGKGFVSATYNPLRRPGKFSKSISVTTNSKPPVTTLRIVGNVIPKPKTLEDIYPRELGVLRLKTNHLALMKLTADEVKVDKIDIVNPTDNPIEVSFRNVPNHIEISSMPETLAPGQEGKIIVKYNAEKKNDWGFLIDKVAVAVNGNTNNNKNRISISATIEEDFSKLTAEERANAPKMVFENTAFNFGTIEQGESVSHSFKFKNEGKSDLIIRKTKASCGCTVVNPSKEVIKPGETAEFKAVFNSRGKQNRQNKSITVITNDPNQPQINLRISGNVKVN